MTKFKIDEERCKGCGLCVEACPKGLLELQSEKCNRKGYFYAALKNTEECVSCAMCAQMCPDAAIEIRN